MTLEEIRKKLVEHGLKEQQAKSKTVAMVLDILKGEGDDFLKCCNLEKEIQHAKVRFENARFNAVIAENDYKNMKALVEDQTTIYKQKNKAYIDKFFAALNECETPEGRDALRKAQLFENSANIKTVYDNTAYINGLAAILTKGESAIVADGLEKIDEKEAGI